LAAFVSKKGRLSILKGKYNVYRYSTKVLETKNFVRKINNF